MSFPPPCQRPNFYNVQISRLPGPANRPSLPSSSTRAPPPFKSGIPLPERLVPGGNRANLFHRVSLLLIFCRVILFVPQSHFVQVKVPDPRCPRSCPPGWGTPQTSPIPMRMKRSRMRNRRDLVQISSSHLKIRRRSWWSRSRRTVLQVDT